jgi:hypothetical protein
LHTGQQEIYNIIHSNKAREILIFCSRRFGKSFLGVIVALEAILSEPGKRAGILAPTEEQAKEIVLPIMQLILSDAPPGLIKHTKSELTWKAKNGSELVLRGFDSKKENRRGSGYDILLLEETGSADPEQYLYVLRSVLKPMLLHSRGKLIHLTTPSPIIDHPLHTTTLPKCQAEGALYVRTIYDNPLLDDEQIQSAIDDSGGESSIDFRREYLCEIVRDTSTVVVPSFNHLKHTSPDAKYLEGSPPSVVLDWGGIRDHTAALFGCWDWQHRRLNIFKELHFMQNTSSGDVVRAVREELLLLGWSETEITIYADAPGQLMVDLAIEHDFHVVMPPKQDKDAAVNALNVAFHKNDILVNPACKDLIQVLRSGQFNKNRTDFARTSVMGHLDLLMAAVYMWRTHQEWDGPRKRKSAFQEMLESATGVTLDTAFANLLPRSMRR